MTPLSLPIEGGSQPTPMSVTKRCLDVAASSLGLIALSPLFLLIALAIWLDSPGPVFFRQIRLARGGRPFKIVKFRSMTDAPCAVGPSLTIEGDRRVTRVGAVLRSTKLDELPQLFNVLVGTMSLVGPRPEVPELLVHYAPAERALLFSVQPGMTDYASLLLRNEGALLARAPDPLTFYRQKVMPIKHQLCARYIAEAGISTDLRLILATVWSVVSGNVPDILIPEDIVQWVAKETAGVAMPGQAPVAPGASTT